MPYIKPISGHTTLGAAQRYLERDGRALARDFLNLEPPIVGLTDDGEPVYGAYDWASVMDTTRAMMGNNTPYRGRKARTYKHYVFSPDPRDGIGLSELRSVTMSWVRENFGDYEVAVVYHNDNEHHISHAHVIVNNTNLETGRRLQDPDPRALKRSAQRIAREHGLTSYVDEPADPETGIVPDSRPYARRNVRASERSLVHRGEYSWVADIRARVDIAKGIARDLSDFEAALTGMGVDIRESAGTKGDWVYSLSEAPSRQVTGSRLGASYTRQEVTSWLRSPVRTKPDTLTADGARIVAAHAIEVRDLGELARLSEAVDVVSRGRFTSLRGIDLAIERTRRTTRKEAVVQRLERVRNYCATHSMLPETSPGSMRKASGQWCGHSTRTTRQQQHSGDMRPRSIQQNHSRERGQR